MRFIQIINHKKFVLVNIFLFFFVALNLLDGERGLISYFEKKNNIDNLMQKKQELVIQLDLIEKKNDLLTGIIDTDYLETLYREKFMVGKSNEKIFVK